MSNGSLIFLSLQKEELTYVRTVLLGTELLVAFKLQIFAFNCQSHTFMTKIWENRMCWEFHKNIGGEPFKSELLYLQWFLEFRYSAAIGEEMG